MGDADLDTDLDAVFEQLPVACALISPDLVFIAVNRAYERLTRPRDQLVGRDVFEALPGDARGADARHWRAVLEWVLSERQPHITPWTRYDIPEPGPREPGPRGPGASRFWSTVNAPLLGPDGRVLLIMHRIEDITAFIEWLGEPPSTADAAARLLEVEGELYARSRELQDVNRRLRIAQQDRQRGRPGAAADTPAASGGGRRGLP